MSRPSTPTKRVPQPSAENPAEGAWAEKMSRLRHRPRARNELRICDDESLRAKVAAAEQAAERARFLAQTSPGDDTLAIQAREAETASAAARTEAADATITLTFQALPRPAFEELITAHPATEAQAEDGAIFNPDTFPAALVAAASFDGMSEAEAGELLATWSTPDANALWEAAWRVQQESRVELGKG